VTGSAWGRLGSRLPGGLRSTAGRLGSRLPAGRRSSAGALDSTWLWARVASQIRRGPAPPPPSWAPPDNAVLLTAAERDAAVEELRRLRLPLHRDPTRNWDTLAALAAILRHTAPSARVLEGGAAQDSTLLAALWRYGYEDLTGIGPGFGEPVRRGPVRFQRGEATASGFGGASFDAIACLSVVQHGVELGAYLREAARLLGPGGILVTSTDFSRKPVQARGTGGAPAHVFTPDEVREALELGRGLGLEPTGEVELDRPHDQTIVRHELGARYTSLVLTLRRTAG
jgi:SAM-dependent methyltransferase